MSYYGAAVTEKYGSTLIDPNLRLNVTTMLLNAEKYATVMGIDADKSESARTVLKIPTIEKYSNSTIEQYDTNKYKIGPFSLTGNVNSVKTIDRIEVVGNNNQAITLDSNQYLLEDGTRTSSIPAFGQMFYIIATNLQNASNIKVSVYHNYETYENIKLYEITTTWGQQPLIIAEGAPNKGQGVKEVEVEGINKAEYSLRVLKSDYSSGSQLTGGSFSVTVNGVKYGQYDTYAFPNTLRGSVSPGEIHNIEIAEVTAPNGYRKLLGTILIRITGYKENEECKTKIEVVSNTLTYQGSTGNYYKLTQSGGNSFVLTLYNRKNLTPTNNDLTLRKVDSKDGRELAGAKFHITITDVSYIDYEVEYQETEKVMVEKVNENGEIEYVEEEQIVTKTRIETRTETKILVNSSYTTNSNGELNIGNITVENEGYQTITITEEKAPEYYERLTGSLVLKRDKIIDENNLGYTVSNLKIERNFSGNKASISSTDNKINIVIKNDRKMIDINGYVWEDEKQGKESELNGIKDSNEKAIKGIQVILHTENGSNILYTNSSSISKTTNSNGYYEFEVPMGTRYYIEFRYNGYNYQHTKYTQYTGASSPITSNATETESKRDEFNNRLSVIEPNTKISGVSIKNTDNDLGPDQLGTNEIYAISAYVGGYGQKDQFIITGDSKNINLGLTKRETVDLAIRKDVYKATLSINGQSQDYIYNRNNQEIDANGNSYWDIDVRKSDSEYYRTYNREIRKADYNYVDINKDNALSVEVTYVIVVRNQSGLIDCNITELVDYYDKDYTFKEAYIESNGTRTNIIASTESEYTHNTNIANYNKLYLKLNQDIRASGDDLIIYVTFTVNTDTEGKIQVDADDGKGNMVEIMGYKTTYGTTAKSPNAENTKTYVEYSVGDIAGRIDLDSNPGNTTSLDENTFEDDTDRAPYIKFSLAENERTVSGMVWEDERNITVEGASIGNGIRDEETPISGVKVQLIDSNTGNVVPLWDGTKWTDSEEKSTTQTKEDGTYIISGFAPGNYYIKFIYSDGQNYKSTTYNYTEVCPDFNINNPDALGTYVETTTNYSDARDIWSRREEVNNMLNTEQTNGTLLDYSNKDISMQAITGNILVNVEKDPLNPNVENGVYNLLNIDFGIQERPKAQLIINKKVTNVNVTLANGNTLFDTSNSTTNVLWTNKDEIKNSSLYQDNKMNETYIKSIPIIRQSAKSILLTMDEELIHGATIKIQYGITVQNIGEIDYASKLFYYTAQKENGENAVKTTVGKIVDYAGALGTIDEHTTINSFYYNANENSGWNLVNLNYLTSEGLVRILDENGNNSTESILKDYNTILIYDINKALSPLIASEEESKTEEIVLILSQVMTYNNSDQLSYNNISEILTVQHELGRKMAYSTIGNQNPSDEIKEVDADIAQSVTILPPFGDTYIYYVLGGVIGIIIVAGIILIKIKVLKPKK